MLRKANGVAAAGTGIAGALGCSQLSEFMQQYRQNLAGRLAEAQRDVTAIAARAREAEMPIYAYLQEFRQATNPVFVREGQALQAKIDRATELAEGLSALEFAGPLTRPFRFVEHLNGEIVADTWQYFQPAVPVDLASLIYATTGAVLGLLAYHLSTTMLAAPVRLARKRRARQAAAN